MLRGRSDVRGTDWPAGVRYQPLGRRVRSWLGPEAESEWATPGSATRCAGDWAGDWAASRDDRRTTIDMRRRFLMKNKGRVTILIERY
jgi:hypothetical protein